MNECAPKQTRRDISDQEMREAMVSPDNRAIIAAVTRRYSKLLDADTLKGCGYRALWRALQYYQPRFRQKFTTSLHRFVLWECAREARQVHSWLNRHTGGLVDETVEAEPSREVADLDDRDFVQTRLRQLPRGWQRRLLRQYYLEGLSLEEVGRRNGLSSQNAHRRVKQALNALRELCAEN